MNCLQMGNQENIIKRSKTNVAEGNTLLDQAQAEPMGSLIIEAPTNHSMPRQCPTARQRRIRRKSNIGRTIPTSVDTSSCRPEDQRSTQGSESATHEKLTAMMTLGNQSIYIV